MKKVNLLNVGDFSFFMAVPAVVWQCCFFYIPALFLLFLSFTKSTSGPIHGMTFTIENYTYFFSPLFGLILVNSLLLAFLTAFFCLLLAYPISYYIAVKLKRFKNISVFFLILPFWTSFMVQAYSWFFVLEHNGLINTLLLKMGAISEPIHMLNTSFSIYLVMVYCYLPFMFMPLYTALEKIDRRLFEAAADLGATQWQTFIRITIPLSVPGIKTGFFLVFVPAFGEFVIPTLLGGGKKLFAGSLITQYFFSARNPYLGSAFTVLTVVILLISVASITWLFNKKGLHELLEKENT